MSISDEVVTKCPYLKSCVCESVCSHRWSDWNLFVECVLTFARVLSCGWQQPRVSFCNRVIETISTLVYPIILIRWVRRGQKPRLISFLSKFSCFCLVKVHVESFGAYWTHYSMYEAISCSRCLQLHICFGFLSLASNHTFDFILTEVNIHWLDSIFSVFSICWSSLNLIVKMLH